MQAAGPQAYPQQQPQYGAAAAAFGGWGGPQGMAGMQSMQGMQGMGGMGAMQAYPYQQQQAAMMGQYGPAMGQYGQYGAAGMQYSQQPYMHPQNQHLMQQQQHQQQRPHRAGGFSRGPTGPRDPAVALAISINKRITAAQRAEEIFAIIENVRALTVLFVAQLDDDCAHSWNKIGPPACVLLLLQSGNC